MSACSERVMGARKMFSMGRISRSIVLPCSLAVVLIGVSTSSGQSIDWVRQWGTPVNDWAPRVVADGEGNAYVAKGSGETRIQITKYDPHGGELWTTNTDSTTNPGLSFDKLGYLFAAGSDHYEEEDGPDAVLSKYDVSGNLIWSTHFSSSGPDTATDVSADGLGNVFLTGQYWPKGKSTAALYVNKYTTEGQLQWTTLIPTDAAGLDFRIAADDLGNIFVGGSTYANLAGRNKGFSDAFIAKLNSGGDVSWIRQFGTPSSDDAMAIAADGLGNAYLGGTTIGSLLKPKQGFSDAFIYKFDTNGNIVWNQQLNDPGFDVVKGLAVADDKTLLALGGGLFPGTENDAFLMQFDDQGQAIRTELFGAKGNFDVTSVDTDHRGGAYVTGGVSVSWGGDWQGASDAYLARFTVPEPSGRELVQLLPLALMSLSRIRRKRSSS